VRHGPATRNLLGDAVRPAAAIREQLRRVHRAGIAKPSSRGVGAAVSVIVVSCVGDIAQP
jgi:hypothetical protein